MAHHEGILGKRLPLVLSPMVDVTDAAFRSVAAEWGADITCSEMVAAVGLLRDSKGAWQHVQPWPGERPYGVQFMCPEPEEMRQAVTKLATRIKPDFIDVNLGCPAPNIMRVCAGGYLMRDPKKAGAVIRAAKEAADEAGIANVSVKMRLGPTARNQNYVEVAAEAEAAGASWVTMHARTVEQGYAGHADWSAIARLVEASNLPVIGNGDIRTPADVVRMREETNCAGFFIARAAMHDPTIFRRMRTALDGRSAMRASGRGRVGSVTDTGPGMKERLVTLLTYLDRAESIGMRNVGELRRQATRFVAGNPDAKRMRVEFQDATDPVALREKVVTAAAAL